MFISYWGNRTDASEEAACLRTRLKEAPRSFRATRDVTLSISRPHVPATALPHQFCVVASATRGKPSTIEQQWRPHAMITLCCLGLPGIIYFSAIFDIYLWWLSHHFAMWWHLCHYTSLRVPLSSIRLSCQLMTKLEAKHILQAQVCDGIGSKNETGN